MSNATNKIVSPQSAILGLVDLLNKSACSTRAPTVTASLAAANIFAGPVANASADTKISKIDVKAMASAIGGVSVDTLIGVWVWDGTTAYMIDEIQFRGSTPSATTPSAYTEKAYDDFNLPATYRLYFSTSVATTSAASALGVVVHGAPLG